MMASDSLEGQDPQADESDFDLVKAAQYGHLERVRFLVEQQKVDCKAGDSQNITPLHWAAINNRLDIAGYFVQQGVDLNAIGGVLQATSLHWAVKRGHLSMVILLVKSGADIRLRDGDGMTALHQASQCGAWSICAYLVSCGQDVDEQDANGMTPIMWACYNSFSLRPVQFMLASNANLTATDTQRGNTALHFAVLASNNVVIPSLLKHGAPLQATNKSGQTPLQCAWEQKSSKLTVQHLETAERAQNNVIDSAFTAIRLNPIRAREAVRAAVPLACLTVFGYTAGVIQGWLPMLGIWALASLVSSYISMSFVTPHPSFRETTPYGLFISVLILMYGTWFGLFWPYVNDWIITIPFATGTAAFIYYTYKAVMTDPGYLDLDSRKMRQDIVELAEKDLLESRNTFCTTCMIKKPLRSKHCQMCDRCVGALDHHCPWVNNCIGCGNHRYFVLYLFWLLVMNLYYLYGAYTYFHSVCTAIKPDDTLSATISKYGSCSPWTFILTVQGVVYTFWITALLTSQLWQVVMLGMTTNEHFNRHRYHGFQRRMGRIASPYHHGILRNCGNFFKCSFCGARNDNYDWRNEYDLSKFVDTDELLPSDEQDAEDGHLSHGNDHGHGHSHSRKKAKLGGWFGKGRSHR